MIDPYEVIADRVPPPGDGYTLVAIDGVDGSGKTTFAATVAARLRQQGRACLVIHVDDFHRPRAERHRRGRDSPLGFWLDTYDYPALHRLVLEPLGPGGDGSYRSRWTDLVNDCHVDEPPRRAEPGTVVILEGLFLHRDELVERWDFSIFLDAPFEITVARMAGRDGGSPDPEHPSQRRYVEGQRLYFEACRPWQRADLVIDNTDPRHPMIITAQAVSAATGS
ncbi:uridine kinase [Microlunatus speluncae]|uniref:uridine kinase n=1 Tax=Microlunatus speluncae TaxID=2594267 RepID=UPI0012664996|nr:uridine kinase [Microlunatus speluncae]